MILVDVPQRSDEWIKLRLGVVTASEVDKIVTRTGRLSAQRKTYMRDLLFEWLYQQPADEFDSKWTEYGREMEPRARGFYEALTDREVKEVGFCYRDESRLVGCSPDGIADGNRSLEIVCPMDKTHLGYWLDNQKGLDYKHTQMQFHIFCGFDYGEFMSFCPRLPHVYREVAPCAKTQDAFSEHIPTFLKELQAAKEQLIEEGYGPRHGA